MKVDANSEYLAKNVMDGWSIVITQVLTIKKANH
jgi:hypothetical protein